MRACSSGRPAMLALALAVAVAGCGGDGGDSGGDGPMLTIKVVTEPSASGRDGKRILGAFAALRAADLDATNQRDATAACEQLECLARVVSDDVSITAWSDDERAAASADHHVGNLGVTFSTTRMRKAEQAAYLEAIRKGAGD